MVNPALEALLGEQLHALEQADPPADAAGRKLLNTRLRNARMRLARLRGSHTQAEWDAIVAETGGICVRCGHDHAYYGQAPLKAHIQPICAGGSDAADNLMPVCRQCASARGEEGIDWLAAWRETQADVTKAGVDSPEKVAP